MQSFSLYLNTTLGQGRCLEMEHCTPSLDCYRTSARGLLPMVRACLLQFIGVCCILYFIKLVPVYHIQIYRCIDV